jgi:RNA polymerase sigma-70 factor (ECF subfamily)
MNSVTNDNFTANDLLYPSDRMMANMSGKEMNDKEIFVRHAFTADPQKGCELLFNTYYCVLCSHAIKYVYSKQIAEDIVGEVFYKFWEKKMYRGISTSYRAYLFTAVRNTALNYLKKEFGRTIVDESSIDEEVLFTNDPHRILQADELNRMIENTIQSLSPKCRQVFVLSRVEAKKNSEISKALNVSIKAVEAHITRALSSIRRVIEKNDIFYND